MNVKDLALRVVETRARTRLGKLAGELARAPSEEKEDILAGIEFERWLADSCRDARREG
jgi:hypothetical protein